MSVNIFRAPPRPSSGAYNCINSLWFLPWNVVVAALLVNNAATTNFQGKTRGCWCSCKLLMMGVEVTETCWVTHKHQVINLWNCCISLFNLFELTFFVFRKSRVHISGQRLFALISSCSGLAQFTIQMLVSCHKLVCAYFIPHHL